MQPNVFVNKRLREFISTTQGKSYTVVVVTAVLVLIIILLGIFPATSAIFLQIEQNSTRNTALELIDTKRNNLRALTTEEQGKKAVTDELNKVIPDNDIGQEDILEFIQESIEKHGLDFGSASFGELEKRRSLQVAFLVNPTIDGVVMTVAADGTRKQIELFVADLENSRRIFNIRSLAIRKADQTSVSDQFRLDVQVELYFWNDDKTSDQESQS